jgi:hypothetical protein
MKRFLIYFGILAVAWLLLGWLLKYVVAFTGIALSTIVVVLGVIAIIILCRMVFKKKIPQSTDTESK